MFTQYAFNGGEQVLDMLQLMNGGRCGVLNIITLLF